MHDLLQFRDRADGALTGVVVFQLVPDQLVGIELWGIRRKKEQPELFLVRLHKLEYLLRLV